MVDPKGSPEIPASADSVGTPKPAPSVKPTPERDPVLEELLRSKSSDSDGAISKKAKAKKSRRAKTGTSLDKRSRKPSMVLVGAIAAGVILLGGGGTALWLTLKPQESQIDDSRNSNRVQGLVAKESTPDNEKSAPWANDVTVFPVELEPWQTQAGTRGVSEEDRVALLATFYGSEISNAASILPTEDAGFTSDDTKALNEDGSLNYDYSYWTKESFTADLGQIVEKFINPRFGEWEAYQGRGSDPNTIDPAQLFPGTFTDELLKKGEPVANWLPIYADWSNNNYGKPDLSATGPRWYGEISNSTTRFVLNSETGQYDVAFDADVKFTAFKSNGEKVSENGKLSLQLVANPNSEKGSGGKVLVNGSKLTIGG